MAGKFYFLLVFMVSWLGGYAQCNKSLGVPILDETFGAGANVIGPPLSKGITNLTYVNSTCPGGGEYSIVRYTTGCFGQWHTLTDHTGDPDGYFMLINATGQPTDFYIQQVNGLCGGTTFEFSAWIMNMVKTTGLILPSITFTVENTDGLVLSTYATGDIPVTNPASWTKYSFYFTTPPGVASVILRMHNNAIGTDGNDLALDDIAFTPIGPQTHLTAPGITGQSVEYPCVGGLVIAADVGPCYPQNQYQWQFSTNKKTFTDVPGAVTSSDTVNLTSVGTYYYRLIVADEGNIGSSTCRIYSDTLTVNYRPNVNVTTQNVTSTTCQYSPYVLPSGKTENSTGNFIDTLRSKSGCDSIITYLNLTVLPQPVTAYLGPPKDLCLSDSVVLNPGSFTSYLWQDGSKGATYEAKSGGIYWVRVTDQNGCVSADSILITQVYCSPVRPPNAFTPNGDGINDTWNITGLQYFLDCTVLVYTRSGQLVFKSTGYSLPWDGRYGGRNLPVGTYYYVINLKNNSPPIAGSVTIIR